MNKRLLYNFLKERDGLTCGICHESLAENWRLFEEWCAAPSGTKKPFKRRKANITVDHIIPKSVDKPWERGQTIYTNRANLQLAHFVCNNKKGNGTPR